MLNENFFNKETFILIGYLIIAVLAFLLNNRKSVLQQPFMLLTTAVFFIYTWHGCAYNLAERSVSFSATPSDWLRDIGVGILWAITLGNYVALLYQKLILHGVINPEPSLFGASSKTNSFISNLESLITGQTTKLELAIEQLQTSLTRQLQISDSFNCISKAVEQATDAICITDAQGFPTIINQAFLNIFGYNQDELNAVGGLFSLLAEEAVRENIHNLLLNGYSWDGEVVLCTRDGELISVVLRADPIEDQKSQVIEIIAILTDLTKYKQAEVACFESSLRLKLAFQAAGMAAWDWNLKTLELTWSNNLETVFGVNPEAFNGNLESLLEYIHPEDHQKLTHAVRYAVDEYVDYTIEFRALLPDGSFRWLESKGQLLYDETGKAVQMLGTVLDITERKEAEAARIHLEEKRRQSQEMLQLVMDNIPEFICWKDRNSVFLGCNQNFARTAGVGTPENIVGLTDYDLPWKKEESDLYRERDARVMETDTPQYHVIETQLQVDGTQAWVEVNKIPLHDAEGNVVGILGTYSDITERKQMEAALCASVSEAARSAAELRALFAAITDVILVLDAQGRYLKIAPTNPPLLYKPAEQLVGKTLHEIFAPQEAEFFLDHIRRALDKKQTIDVEYSLSINGTQVWFAASISPMQEDTVICVARDITGRYPGEPKNMNG